MRLRLVMKLRCPKPRTPLDSRDLEGDKTQESARPCLSPYLVKGYSHADSRRGAARIGMVYSMVYCRYSPVSPVGVAPRSVLKSGPS